MRGEAASIMARFAERMLVMGVGEQSGTSWTSAFQDEIWERRRMMTLAKKVLIVSVAILCGALSIWAIYRDEAREINDLVKGALCVLELPAGSPSASASFTTSQTVDELHVGVRPGAYHERLSVSISGSEGPICSVTTESTLFSFGREIPPGTYTLTLGQETGNHGALVAIADRKPTGVTGWQILSRSLLGLVVVSGVWAFIARRSKNLRQRAASSYTFQMFLLCFGGIFLYLLLHEGGHALGEILFGRYDFARSDFWGIHGYPHSGGTSGPPLEAWQQAVISGGGPLFPTLIGWGLFLLWTSSIGRKLRSTRPIVSLYFSAIVAGSVFPFVAVAGDLLGIVNDGELHGFIANAPGPLWLVKALLWGVLLVNAIILWRVVPELWRAWKAQLSDVWNLRTL